MQLHIPPVCTASSEGAILYEEPFACTENLFYRDTMYILYTVDQSYGKLHVANMSCINNHLYMANSTCTERGCL